MFCFLLALLTMASTPSDAATRPIRIGLFPFHSPQHLVTYYDSLRRHFEKALQLPVQLETAPSVEDYTSRAIRGDYDVALIPAHLGRQLQVDYRWQPLARYMPDNTVYLITRKQDAIKEPSGLKGKVIATHDRSLLMSLAAQRWLRERGVMESDIDWLETGGLASSVYAVVTGQAVAAVATLSSLSLTRQAELDQLDILVEVGNIPQLYLMANPRMPNHRKAGLRAACDSYRKDGNPVLARVTEKELKSLDAYTAEIRMRLPGQPRTKDAHLYR
jgi:ABC-type phosphate/phosphonate transport system substrate-binding protein